MQAARTASLGRIGGIGVFTFFAAKGAVWLGIMTWGLLTVV